MSSEKNTTTPHMNTAWIALGGNIGEVLPRFQSVRHALDTHPLCQIEASARVYQTPPVGPEGQDDYLNSVLRITTSLKPLPLLDVLQQLEQQHGRIRHEHWGARTLDLDIIAYDKQTYHDDRLTLPHQHMHWRSFVLRPMCDINPEWLHPILQQTAEQLYQSLLEQGETILPCGKKW